MAFMKPALINTTVICIILAFWKAYLNKSRKKKFVQTKHVTQEVGFQNAQNWKLGNLDTKIIETKFPKQYDQNRSMCQK